jgi:hypothetical protein
MVIWSAISVNVGMAPEFLRLHRLTDISPRSGWSERTVRQRGAIGEAPRGVVEHVVQCAEWELVVHAESFLSGTAGSPAGRWGTSGTSATPARTSMTTVRPGARTAASAVNSWSGLSTTVDNTSVDYVPFCS